MKDLPANLFACCFTGAMVLVLPVVIAGMLLVELVRSVKEYVNG